MVHLEDRSLIDIISDWQLPKPVSVVRLDGGFTGDVWRVEANGQLYIAKLAYESRDSFEIGLLASEIVERHGLRSGAPLRTPGGDVTVMVEHPPGKQHPLALLRFVPGDPLELIAPAGLHTYGKTLGRIHHILIDANYKPERSDSLFPYLIEPRKEVDEQGWLRLAISAAVNAVRDFESRTPVTYGAIYGDALQLRVDPRTDQIGVIDWGATDWGPLLFDVALAIQAAKHTDIESEQHLIEGYLEEGPVSSKELQGLSNYQALMWARSARYFAWRFAHDVKAGDSRTNGNAIALADAKRNLERLLKATFT